MRSTKTMVYAPEIRIVISTPNRTYDVSADVLKGSIQRRIDAFSSLTFTLDNKNAKYTGKIGRMDRVVVFMKRIKWVQVFAGYTSTVPVADLYATTCEISAACTIVKLHRYFWNPNLPASALVMNQPVAQAADTSQLDSGIGRMLSNLLTEVGRWDKDSVHIQNLPSQFLEFTKQKQLIQTNSGEVEEAYLKNVAKQLGITTASIGTVGNAVVNPSVTSVRPGGPDVTFTPAEIAAQAYLVGLPETSIAMAVAVALAESSGRTFITHFNADQSTDYGLWQINSIHAPNDYIPNHDMNSMLDPANNARAMFAISKGGTDWSPWVTFQEGDQNQFLDLGRQAAAGLNTAALKAKLAGGSGGTASPQAYNAPAASVENGRPVSAQGSSTSGTASPQAYNSAAPLTGPAMTAQAMVDAGVRYLGLRYSWGGGNTDGPTVGIHDDGGSGDAHGDYAAVGFDCVAEGTMVSTARGAVPIEKLIKGEMVYAAEGMKTVLAPVKTLVDKGLQEGFRIRLRSRSIVATAGHEIKVLRKNKGWRTGFSALWVKVRDLHPEDQIVTLRGQLESISPATVSPDVAWLWGAYLGDGHVSNEKSIYWCLFGEDRDKAAFILKEKFGVESAYSDTHGLRVRVGSKAIATEALSTIGTGSANKRVPEWVWDASKESQQSFLEGYLSADGHLDKKGWRTFDSISKVMLSEVRELAIRLGMNVSNLSETKRIKPITIKGKLVASAKPIYRFQIYNGLNEIPKKISLHGGTKLFEDKLLSSSKILSVESVGLVRMFDIEVPGPASFFADGILVHNCSGLILYMVAKGTNGELVLPHYTGAIWDQLKGHQVPRDQMQPGDIVLYSYGTEESIHHVSMYLGNDQMIEAPQSGGVVQIVKQRTNGFHGAVRIPQMLNAPPFTINVNGSANSGGGGGVITDAEGNTTGSSSSEVIANALFRYLFWGVAKGEFLFGDKSFINSEMLFSTVKTVAAAGMRSFMSAPNGDFIAFYPDPFGILGKQPAMQIEDIELIDFSISANEGELTTHVFTSYDPTMAGGIGDAAWQDLSTTVSIEDKAVMKSLLNIPDSDPIFKPAAFYEKYGMRPYKTSFGDIRDPNYNYFQALYIFLQKWSDQYSTKVQFTFMPELYPGIRIRVESQDITVYVKEVTHSWDLNNGFTTNATVNSPTSNTGENYGFVRST